MLVFVFRLLDFWLNFHCFFFSVGIFSLFNIQSTHVGGGGGGINDDDFFLLFWATDENDVVFNELNVIQFVM